MACSTHFKLLSPPTQVRSHNDVDHEQEEDAAAAEAAYFGDAADDAGEDSDHDAAAVDDHGKGHFNGEGRCGGRRREEASSGGRR